MQGCYFHFAKAILDKIKDLGLYSEYDVRKAQHNGFQPFIKTILALPFLPPDLVKDTFENLVVRFQRSFELFTGNNERLAAFVSYFRSQWLRDTVSWNCFDIDLYRTNNHLEGYHSALLKFFGLHEPRFWKWVKKLQRLHETEERTLLQLHQG